MGLFLQKSRNFVIICNVLTQNNTLALSLKNRGYSLTAARTAVFGALSEHGAATMRELISYCPSINRASVYRTVELFEKLTITHRVHIGWKYKVELSDKFDHHHHHATCTRCGASIILNESPAFERAIKVLADSYRFSVSSHQVELFGLCVNCREMQHAF